MQKVDITSKGRHNVARAPQVPMPRQGQHRSTASRVPWVELTPTTISGLRAKSVVLGPSRQTTRMNWSLRTPCNVPIVLPGRLMATRTLAARVLCVRPARQTQPHDPSTKMRAYDATLGGGPTVKEWQAAQIVQQEPIEVQGTLMDACLAMHHGVRFVKSARDTRTPRLDTLRSSWPAKVVATRRS